MTVIEKEIKKKKEKVAKVQVALRSAKEDLQNAKYCKENGLTFVSFKLPTNRQIEAKWKAFAKSLPKEKRQEVLDAYHEAKLCNYTVDDVIKKCGVTPEEYYGIINLNTKTITHKIVNIETV